MLRVVTAGTAVCMHDSPHLQSPQPCPAQLPQVHRLAADSHLTPVPTWLCADVCCAVQRLGASLRQSTRRSSAWIQVARISSLLLRGTQAALTCATPAATSAPTGIASGAAMIATRLLLGRCWRQKGCSFAPAPCLPMSMWGVGISAQVGLHTAAAAAGTACHSHQLHWGLMQCTARSQLASGLVHS